MLSVVRMLNVSDFVGQHCQVQTSVWPDGESVEEEGELMWYTWWDHVILSNDDRVIWDCVTYNSNRTTSGGSSDEEANSEVKKDVATPLNKK